MVSNYTTFPLLSMVGLRFVRPWPVRLSVCGWPVTLPPVAGLLLVRVCYSSMVVARPSLSFSDYDSYVAVARPGWSISDCDPPACPSVTAACLSVTLTRPSVAAACFSVLCSGRVCAAHVLWFCDYQHSAAFSREYGSINTPSWRLHLL